ncbi:Uma2 family endonuclease [Paludisphaera sp.]|uniref:Uma2 family endonuclease n=1 Tax=Paludisphaera sp. TaxID=2017432 RepID=UPI00301C4676
MGTSIARSPEDLLLYPDDDGEPMSDNTVQFRWICTIVEGLQFLFRDRPDVFVAGNLLWYAREGFPEVRTAPVAMVVLGRPKGERGSYMQWREAGVPPTVVFEVRSPSNTDAEMKRKRVFYERHGVREYYFFDPDGRTLQGWIRRGDRLDEIDDIRGWTSPLLGIRFEPEGPEGLTIYHPDGSPFDTALEAREDALAAREAAMEALEAAREERGRKLAERRRAEEAESLAEAERQRAEAERERAERYLARLRELGELED